MMNDESPFISWDPLQCHHLLAGNVSQYAWNDGMKYFHDFLMFFDFFYHSTVIGTKMEPGDFPGQALDVKLQNAQS